MNFEPLETSKINAIWEKNYTEWKNKNLESFISHLREKFGN